MSVSSRLQVFLEAATEDSDDTSEAGPASREESGPAHLDEPDLSPADLERLADERQVQDDARCYRCGELSCDCWLQEELAYERLQDRGGEDD